VCGVVGLYRARGGCLIGILYSDPEIILQRYVSAEPIVDAFNADVIEGAHFLWRRHAETVLAYYPRVPWGTTSASYTITGTNDATAETERLGMYPMMRDGWRPDVGGDTKLACTVVGGLVDVLFEVYEGGVLVDSDAVLVGAGPLAIVSGALTLPAGTQDAWVKITARRNGESGTGQIDAIYVRSAYDSGAPK